MPAKANDVYITEHLFVEAAFNYVAITQDDSSFDRVTIDAEHVRLLRDWLTAYIEEKGL